MQPTKRINLWSNWSKMDLRGPKLTKWTKVDLIGSNGTEVDLIGPNRNSLFFRENKLSSTNFRKKKKYIILQYKIIIYFHESCEFATSCL